MTMVFLHPFSPTINHKHDSVGVETFFFLSIHVNLILYFKNFAFEQQLDNVVQKRTRTCALSLF